MPNAEKVEKVEALKERIAGSNALLLAEYRGLSVHDATELRRSLSEAARFSVVKNTLMLRAADEAGISELEGLLSGPTAVAFVQGDVVAAAKKVVDAAKRFPALVLKGAYLDGKVLDAESAQALATLESREVMLSKIAGILKSEMSKAAAMFQATQARFLGLLDAYRDKVSAAAPEAAAPAEPTDAGAEPADAGAEPADAGAEPAEAIAEPAEAIAEPAEAAEEAPAEAPTDESPEASTEQVAGATEEDGAAEPEPDETTADEAPDADGSAAEESSEKE
jgi:large subunit ribosomal protein L10